MPHLLPSKPRGLLVAAWMLLAALNLAAGVVIASWPERQTDFASMYRWTQLWRVEHVRIYQESAPTFSLDPSAGLLHNDQPDYPPHAIVLLSPLTALPEPTAFAIWVLLNLAMAPMAPLLAIRAARPDARLTTLLLPVAMFLCWGGFRALQQFTLLALVCGLAAVVCARRRPVLSGLLLGVSLMKPQVAMPFVLWMCFARRISIYRILGTAAALVGGGTLIYCAVVQASPIALFFRYTEILRMFYGGEAIMLGLSQIRPIVMVAVTNAGAVDAICAVVALALLGGVVSIGLKERAGRETLPIAAPAMAGIWSLLTFYHLTYGFLLLLPTAAWLLYSDDASTIVFRRRVFWTLQAALMFDAATIGRWFGPAVHLPNAAGALLMHVDRVLMLVLFYAMVVLYARTRPLAAT